MKTIKLDENYHIEVDSENVCLKFRREKEVLKQGELKTVTEKNEWHSPRIELALKRYLHETQKECETINEVLERINEVEQIIKNVKI